MKEIVVISGKGGTGKTSITASLAHLLKGNAVIADYDVDAADFHIIASPQIRERGPFSSSKKASVIPENCRACGKCLEACRFGAIEVSDGLYRIDSMKCEGCGVCKIVCPFDAVNFGNSQNGEWFVSDTRFGTFVHAGLFPGEENSGKLVTHVKLKAREIAQEQRKKVLLADGSPGVGCPVISSLASADAVLAVTEPTLSGIHDLDRVLELTRGFGIDTFICINKSDINNELTEKIREKAGKSEIEVLADIPYDRVFIDSQIIKKSVVEYDSNCLISKRIKDMSKRLKEILEI
ncbi:MAG: 4Fe-4S binding protein [Fibrobacterota bacterium]